MDEAERKRREEKEKDDASDRGMIARLKRLGFFKRLIKARRRRTDSGHTVGADNDYV